MYIVFLLIFAAVSLIFCARTPKTAKYTRLDRAGVVLNAILSVAYVPLSLLGVFSVFAADGMSLFSKAIQVIIEIMIFLGVSLPFVSVAAIALSVIFRRKGKHALGFVIQFAPLMIFVFMIVVFALAGSLVK